MKISVVIPVHNEGEELYSTVESVINQTLPEYCYEIAILDNSDANCNNEGWLSTIQQLFPRVTIYRNKGKVLTRIANWNRCLDYLRWVEADYAKIVCAGDTLEPTCLEEQFNKSCAYYGLVTSAHRVINPDGTTYNMTHFPVDSTIDLENVIKKNIEGNWIGGCMASPLFKVGTLGNVHMPLYNFNESLEWAADWLFWASISRAYSSILYLTKPLVNFNMVYRKHYNALVNTETARLNEEKVRNFLSNPEQFPLC